MVRGRALSGMCLFVVAFTACLQPGMADEVEFPIVITDGQDLNRLGIELSGWGGASAFLFPNNCYYYGDGGYDISLSPDFLARFKQRGFSRRSLCMAIQGGIIYDPETGKHMPSFISADMEALKMAGQYPEPGIVSDELPLDVPQCFSRGLPYSDCEMKYDPISGEPLSAAIRKKYRQLGKEIESTLSKAAFRKASGRDGDDGAPGETISVGGGQPSLSSNELSAATFYDYSDTFPKGFGYALYADGAAGPDADVEAVELVRDNKQRATEAVLRQVEEMLKKE